MSQNSKGTGATTPEQPIKAIEVQAVTHKIDVNTAIFFTVEPRYADHIDDITTALAAAVGHGNVSGIPVEAGAIKIYQAERPMVMTIDQGYPLADIEGHGNDMWPQEYPTTTAEAEAYAEPTIPTFRLENWTVLTEGWDALSCFHGRVYGHSSFIDGSVHYTPNLSFQQRNVAPHEGAKYAFGSGKNMVIYLLGTPAK